MLCLRIVGPLMLLFSLCDAESKCPPELGGLILDPPEIIGKYGETISVNCSTLDEEYDGIYWILGDKASSLEVEESFMTSQVSLSDWNMTAECRVKLNATLECSEELKITIYKDPEAVSVFSTHNVKHVVEGTPYELKCDILHVAPVQKLNVTWYMGETRQIIKTESFNSTKKTPWDVSSTHTFYPSRADGNQFTCEAYLDFGPHPPVLKAAHYVSVHYAPEFRDNRYEVLVGEGQDVTLTCDAEGMPPPVFSWAHDGVDILEYTSSLNVSRVTTNATYTCTATNYLGNITKQIDVYAMKIAASNGVQPRSFNDSPVASNHYAPELENSTDVVRVSEGDNVTLTCEAEGMPSPVFSWARDGVDILEYTSGLHVSRVNTNATYTCTATNYLGNITKQIDVYVLKTMTTAVPAQKAPGCPLILTPAKLVVRFGDPASVNCSTTATSVMGLGWEASCGGSSTTRNSSLIWGVDKLEEWTVKPMCYANLNDRQQCSVTLPITIYKMPDSVVVPASNSSVMVEGKDHQLKCDIVNVAPVRNLEAKWYRGNELVHTEKFSDRGEKPVNVSSVLRVTPKRGHHRAVFKCKAELHLGPDGPTEVPNVASSPYIADVLFAPVLKQENHTREVTLDENVTLACSAEGNPAPVILWSYTSAGNVMETTRGSQKNISITGATSTNAGVYICVATNEVGSVTGSVTLMMKGETSAHTFPFPWWILIPVIAVILLLIFVIYYKSRRKQGQYDFVPGKDIPMTSSSGAGRA